jgi:CelD/BcsL family acetyltransferase involved in cellulose biosynthesis
MEIAAADSFANLASEWDTLADGAGAAPFLRPSWLGPWWEAFGRGRLEILTARRDGRLVGVLPLARRRGVLSSLTNAHTPEFGILAAEREATVALAEALQGGRARRTSLAYVDAAGPTAVAVRAAAERAGRRVAAFPIHESPYIELDADWETFQRRLGGKFIADLRRRRRRLEEMGETAVEIFAGGEELRQLLEEGFRLENSGWKARAGTSILSQEETRRHYARVAAAEAARGTLRLAFLRVGGRGIAFQFALEDAGRWYFVKGGYDPDWHRFAPAKQLLLGVLEHAHGVGLESFEFLGAAEPWKLEWTQATRPRALLHAYARTPAGALDRLAVRTWLSHGKPLARRIRDRVRA